MWNVLLVEDDPVTTQIITKSAGREFSFTCCSTLAEAQKQLAEIEGLALILIDRLLPDGDGLSLCDFIRRDIRHQNLPVIFLTSRQSESDKVSGFFAGADDYVTKPFSPLELKARMLARLRGSKVSHFWAGKMELDLEAHRAFVVDQSNRTEINLTRIEFKLLVALAQSLDKVLSREALLNKVWGDNTHVTDRVVDSHLSHLRKKISASDLLLESLRGEGYRLTAQKNKKSNHAA